MYSYSQIKKMTNSFEVKLGHDSFGSVYRGELHSGNLVAVNILSELKGNGKDFVNEVASVGMTCHVNIVSLVGFCLEVRRRALIYEFMPNGSLEKFIYDRGPSNQNMCPKISDFGVAKLFPDERSKISMSHMRGTPGYIAPEMFSRNFGEVSNKSDVYSYGMMILEMFNEQLGLHRIVRDEENDMVRKTIIVGLWCIQTNPLNRPTITRVLEMLEGDLELLEILPKPYLSSLSRPVSSCSPSTSFPSTD
ncbi:protein kinase-like domain, concanavalin A-like lectin/glucanase domain protein [Tanacetum coccineum]